ncbi:hypothetical protein WBJ53_19530 [Spirosoma sp. SC4-14]|uniref:hypothetical protein n=1 Tax=Spirosoma sp. SC4-14 TaxID=3128900 RepID=UPI0030D4D6C4
MSSLIVSLFSIGTTIFYVLSCIERRVLQLAFAPGKPVEEPDVRFVHQSLKRLIPVMPPSNGLVLLGGTALLIYQAITLHGDWSSIVLIVYYWGIQLFIFLGLNVSGAIQDVLNTPSDSSILEVSRGVKQLVLAHHAGLVQNFGTVLLQFLLIID